MSRSIGFRQRREITIIHAEGVSWGNDHVFRGLDLLTGPESGNRHNAARIPVYSVRSRATALPHSSVCHVHAMLLIEGESLLQKIARGPGRDLDDDRRL